MYYGRNEALYGVRRLHVSCGSRNRRPTRGHQTTRGRASQTGCQQSEQARPKAQAEGSQALRLGPRFRVLVPVRFSHLAGDFGESETLPNDAPSQSVEAVPVSHVLPMVEPKRLLVHVPEKVERLNADVGSTEAALQKAPEVLQTMAIDADLFAGAGGLAAGLKMAGFAPAELYEFDHISCDTLRHNVKSSQPSLAGTVHEEDVSKVRWRDLTGPVRLLAAGAPCQPFSLGGKHRAEHDGRNLFPEVIRAVRELRPAAVFLENVRGLLRNAFRPYFEYLLRQLECPSVKPKPLELWQNHDERVRRYQCSVGYEPEYVVTWRLVDAANFGAAQNRQRIFMVATRNDLPPYRFPAPTHSRQALLHSQHSGEYWKRHMLRKPNRLPSNRDGAKEDGRLPWVTVRDQLDGLPDPSDTECSAWMNHWRVPGARLYAGHAGSVLDWPSKTIKAGVHGVPGGENIVIEDNGHARYYTLREAARIQSFPDTHFFAGARIHVTRQIGNAVPCRLAAALAAPLYRILKDEHDKKESAAVCQSRT